MRPEDKTQGHWRDVALGCVATVACSLVILAILIAIAIH